MKARYFLIFLAVALMSLVGSAAPRKETLPKTSKRTVLEYFRLLPEKYFNVNRQSLLSKNSSKRIDIKNDYLKTTGGDGQPFLEVAIFRYHGQDLVAVSQTYALDHDFNLLSYRNGGWDDMTRKLVPGIVNEDLYVVLPRYGTTIKLFAPSGAPKGHLIWYKGTFDLHKN